MRKKTIKTERLFLREMTEQDFDALYAVLSDSDIMRHYPYTFDEKRVPRRTNENMERYNTFGFGLWAVCLKESGEKIGNCGLTIQMRVEIGYRIRKDRQRKENAGEAAAAVRDCAFENTLFCILYFYRIRDKISTYKTALSIGYKSVGSFRDEGNEIIRRCAVSR